MSDNQILEMSELNEGEEGVDQITTRVWRLHKYWWVIFLFPVINSISFIQRFPFVLVVINLLLLWLCTYLIRQRWRLTLTNKQIIARQLFPRPFTWFSQSRHFPHKHIEGLSVGPRAFKSILLIGVFISSNLGVTLLKSGLSPSGYDLPDSVDALILLLRGFEFSLFDQIADQIIAGYKFLIDITVASQIGFGIAFLTIGALIVIISIPRRYHLQIRVRNGRDLQLYAGIPKSFWKQSYEYIYGTKTVEAPKGYKKWDFPWLEGEEVETNADLEQIVYFNRFISLFAIGAGSYRIYTNLIARNILRQQIIYWVVLALIDIFIAVISVVHTKKKNEMLVTNKRIIFAQESQSLSGSYGKRLYLMSDIARDDVAGFSIRKIKGFSIRYLMLAALLMATGALFYKQIQLYIVVLGIISVGFLLAFVNQTYLEFDVKTKGNERWHLRHQLSNPATFMRRLVGDENVVLTTLMSNRLEEKEIVDTMQIIRQEDINLPAKIHSDTKYQGKITKAHKIDKSEREELARKITIDDLLLNNEEIVYTTNVSRGVPRRVLTLTVSTFAMLLFLIPMTIGPLGPIFEDNILGIPEEIIGIYFSILGVGMIIMVIALWIRYYSLYKATLWVTTDRVLISDTKKVPWFLYYLGIYRENIIEETLREEIHSTFVSRQFSRRGSFGKFIRHGLYFLLSLIIAGISMAVSISIAIDQELRDSLGQLHLPLWYFLLIVIVITTFNATWNLGNAGVQLIRSVPRRVVNIKGIGTSITIPYASKEKADDSTYSVWSGTERK